MSKQGTISGWNQIVKKVKSVFWIFMIWVAAFSIFAESVALFGEDFIELSELSENESDVDEEVEELDLEDEISHFLDDNRSDSGSRKSRDFYYLNKDKSVHLEILSPPPDCI